MCYELIYGLLQLFLHLLPVDLLGLGLGLGLVLGLGLGLGIT